MGIENRQELDALVQKAWGARFQLMCAERRVAEATAAIMQYTPEIVQRTNELREISQQIRAAGYHDVGHLKGALAKPEETK